MKKKLFLLLMVSLIICSGALVIITPNNKKNEDFDVMLELLTQSEYSGQLCYKQVNSEAPSQWVLYCGHCDGPVEGAPVLWAGTKFCD